MVREIDVFSHAGLVLEKMGPGVFLNSSFDGVDNTMIIGWGGIQIVWGRPIFVVLVRDNRATYSLLEQSKVFTVSVPTNNPLKQAIAICGTKSLRDFDKFERCSLTKIPGRKVPVPIIGECGLHYECKVVYQQTLSRGDIPEGISRRYYDNNAIHTVYYGEIVDQYLYEME
ncbi:MAG: flavin reductase family protein [Candidatus Izemoplasmatales bacterium]|nr:flavin reductase family protein [Candidatus Izemoplasmatales bacterium]